MAIRKILILIRRFNGDVILTAPLINQLRYNYPTACIDLLVNSDTKSTAEVISGVKNIFVYDYKWKQEKLFRKILYEWQLIKTIIRKYDISINLTANDRSVIYALLAAKTSISAVDNQFSKSWWKKLLLTHSFAANSDRHIVEYNLTPLMFLGIKPRQATLEIGYEKKGMQELENLPFNAYKPFLIFHPSARYDYKIYPKNLRNKLLGYLNSLNIPIAVTGGKSVIDYQISKDLPKLKNIYDLIGKTSISGFISLCNLSEAYIGMDTLAMHIAAALNKRIFAIFGPTFPQIWSPWCNTLHRAATSSSPIQTYGNITLLQADMPCVACGKAGCDDHSGVSKCLGKIAPETIFNEVKKWLIESA